MPGRVILEVTSGPVAGRSFVFDRHDTFLFGRHSACHARILKDPLISRHHFLIEANPPDARLRDLGSLNGTYVNRSKIGGRTFQELPVNAGQSFGETELSDGDQIVIGTTTIRVRIETSCVQCGAIIPSDEVASASANGTSLCSTCRPRLATTLALLPAPPCCDQCGKDVSQEVGISRPGNYLCMDCRRSAHDESGGLHQLVQQAVERSSDDSFRRMLSAYEVGPELGKGGMGVVYRAIRKADDCTVAIKMMLSRVAVDEPTRQGFLREIEIGQRLEHPHVVRFYESGSAGCTFFFVMEFCNGGSLHDLLHRNRGKLRLESIAPLMLQCLEGLAYAHQAGFVHRDLKPQNLLLAVENGRPMLKISDFGLAKHFAFAGLSGMTATGSFGGTYYFMPREQLTDFKYARPPSDVWSLAASFYYLLTARYPLEFPAGRDPVEVILYDEPVPVRDRDPAIPASLAAVIDRALATKPENRYDDAGQMLAALKAALD